VSFTFRSIGGCSTRRRLVGSGDCILSAPAVVVVVYLGVVAGGHRDRGCGGEGDGEGLDGPHLVQRC
jgi:hypothetical protein